MTKDIFDEWCKTRKEIRTINATLDSKEKVDAMMGWLILSYTKLFQLEKMLEDK